MIALTLPAATAALTHTRQAWPVDSAEAIHLRRHMTDGCWHDACRACARRRREGGTGLDPAPLVVRYVTATCPPPPAGGGRAAERVGDGPWRIAIHADATGMSPEPPTVGEWVKLDGRTLQHPDGRFVELTFDAIVATAVITEALPIYDAYGGGQPHHPGPIIVRSADKLWLDSGGRPTDISVQLPYADWTPGRVAFELTDVKPTTERCPTCWGEGGHADGSEWGKTCDTCLGDGYCPPIPMAGPLTEWQEVDL